MSRKSTFAGASAVVTGGASGLGLELAKSLLHRGASVAVLDIDKPALQRSTVELQQISPQIVSFECDVTDGQAFELVVAKVREKLGSIHHFFNNAGIGGTLPFVQATFDQWTGIVNVNLVGTIRGTTLAFRIMKAQGYGHIINVSSIRGLLPIPGQVLYNTTQFAVTGLTQSLRYEARAYGIRLTEVCPGPIRTPIFYEPIIGDAVAADLKRIPSNALEPSVAAEKVLDGVARGRSLSFLPFKERLGYWMYRVSPKLLESTFRSIWKKGSERETK